MILFLFLLIPPLKEPLFPVSGFGEYRELHFHTGIDFSTSGKEGVPLYAIDEGTLYRIVVSYGGYGKTIYIKLKDGRIAVYAHLLKFTSYLDSIIYFKQIEKKNYFVDLMNPPNITFNEGDLVGYSGRSGVGPPHLHFEIRTPRNHPLNPLFLLPIKDTIPPKMESITFIPRKKETLIDGYPFERTYSFIMEEKSYTLKETPNLLGNFGIILRAYDRLYKDFKFSLYKILLFIDGELVFSFQMDSIDFARNSLSELFYRSKSRYEWDEVRLFNLDKIRLPQVKTSASSYELSPGLHEMHIEIFDFAENVSEANFIVESNEFSKKKEFIEPDWKFLIEESGTLAIYATEKGLLLRTSNKESLELNGLKLSPFHEKGARSYYFVREPGFLAVKGKINKNFIGVVIDSEGGYLPFGPLILEISKKALPEPTIFWATELVPKETLSSEVEKPILFLPEIPPTLKTFKILRSGKGYPQKIGVFQKRGEWNFVGKESGEVRVLGEFALIIDTIAPSFKFKGKKNGDFWGILIDNKSGIDYRSLEFYLDNEWVPVDYDLETGTLRYHPVVKMKRGVHIFELRVKDGVGNRLEQKVKLHVK